MTTPTHVLQRHIHYDGPLPDVKKSKRAGTVALFACIAAAVPGGIEAAIVATLYSATPAVVTAHGWYWLMEA